jgi:hypothetical protein
MVPADHQSVSTGRRLSTQALARYPHRESGDVRPSDEHFRVAILSSRSLQHCNERLA